LRVLFLRRVGRRLHLHLPDGTATNITFDLDHDDPDVLNWVGAGSIPDGGEQWFGLVALRTDSQEEQAARDFLGSSVRVGPPAEDCRTGGPSCDDHDDRDGPQLE